MYSLCLSKSCWPSCSRRLTEDRTQQQNPENGSRTGACQGARLTIHQQHRPHWHQAAVPKGALSIALVLFDARTDLLHPVLVQGLLPWPCPETQVLAGAEAQERIVRANSSTPRRWGGSRNQSTIKEKRLGGTVFMEKNSLITSVDKGLIAKAKQLDMYKLILNSYHQ